MNQIDLLNDIYHALFAGMKRAEDLRYSGNLNMYQLENVTRDLNTFQSAMKAYDILARDLREGRRYTVESDSIHQSECTCHLGNPPCGWCTDSKKNPDND